MKTMRTKMLAGVGIVVLGTLLSQGANAGIIGKDGASKIYQGGAGLGFGTTVFSLVNTVSPSMGRVLVSFGIIS
jgi:hypothetical protein